MAIVQPFRALLYGISSGDRDISRFVAPPYDVIDSQLRDRLEQLSQHNIVRVILPEAPQGQDQYQLAANHMAAWKREGILGYDSSPGFYIWTQEFNLSSKTFTRRALVARVACEPYGRGGVLPHEKTHRGPKADRLRLFQATNTQFSQIFGLFPDPGGAISEYLTAESAGEQLVAAHGTDGQYSTLHRIDDPGAVEFLRREFSPKSILIADGHHRYETCVNYYESAGKSGSVLMTLVPDSDPGLVVLPTHRTVALSMPVVEWPQTELDNITVKEGRFADWQELYTMIRSRADMILAVAPHLDRTFTFSWESSKSMSPEFANAAQLGDVGVVHHILLPGIAAAFDEPQATEFGYYRDADEAVRSAALRGEWAFLIHPTEVDALLRVSDAGRLMPQKSTYFAPKFLSGFVNADLD